MEYVCGCHRVALSYEASKQVVFQAALKHWCERMVFSLSMSSQTPDEINTLFDRLLSMPKEAVSCMLRRWLGDADFAKGLHAYFWKAPIWKYHWSWLWNALGQHQVVMLQPSWIGITGYPVHCQVENDVLKISQKQFLYRWARRQNRLWVVAAQRQLEKLARYLETESIEILAMPLFLLKMKKTLRLNFGKYSPLLQTTKETC